MIYLPGMEGTGKLFYRQEPELSSHYKVVCLPSRSTPPFVYEDLIEDVYKVVESECAEKATIVAESFGGTVALQFALRHQDRVQEMILVNTFPYFRRRIRLRLGLLLLPLTFIPLGNVVREFFYKTALGFEGVPIEDRKKVCECSFSHGYATSKNRMKLIQSLDVREHLSEIRIPVTIVASVKDKMVPSENEARLMSKQMPNARVILLADHGHTPMITPTFSLLSVIGNNLPQSRGER